MAAIGELMNDHRPVCGHSNTPHDPKCGRPALWHVLVDHADAYGLTSLAACGTHLTIAASCAEVLQLHAYNGACGMPGTLWNPDGNLCVLDDSGMHDIGAEVA